jgi:hypothetical protein
MMRFLLLLNCLIAVGAPAHAAGQTSERSVHRLTIGLVEREDPYADSLTRSSSDGVTLGIEEAQRTAKLFGWEVAVLQLPESLAGTDGKPVAAGVTAIVGDLTATRVRPLWQPPRALLFDIGKPATTDPGECGDRAFHLLSPNVSISLTETSDKASPTREVKGVSWHPALERFGAAQLNDRYRNRFGRQMDERAWAGWMSIKILLDAALKMGTSEQCALERFLLSSEARFDGHKGVALFFDPSTRELVQPRYAPRTSGEPEAVEVHDNKDGRVGASAVDRARCVEACG